MISSVCSLTAGLLFGIGWLLWVDNVAFNSVTYNQSIHGSHFLPGIMQTMSLIMINLIAWETVSSDSGFGDEGGGCLAKAWIFVAFCLSFGALIGSFWIVAQQMHSPTQGVASVESAMRGLMQNLLIFFASLLFRVGRTRADA